jgi:predicted RNA polymerase sigma factor
VASATKGAIDAAWRIESARLIGGLASAVRDVGLAEDLAQDALVAALEQWPESGSSRGDRRRRRLLDPGQNRGLPRHSGPRRGHRLVGIASLYGELVALTRSPIVELNRAVAASMADGPAAGLAVTDGLLDVAALRNYHLLPSVRRDLLVELGRSAQARAEFARTAVLTSNEAERTHLLSRAGRP